MLVVSPFARVNDIDHNLTDQASILNLIEYNWHLPGIPGSADQVLAKLDHSERIPFDLAGMFDFKHPDAKKLILNTATGEPAPGRTRHRR